jgi:predicted regulator of Ras-like GTPase activity (Roadblock/LC7/MglB family)
VTEEAAVLGILKDVAGVYGSFMVSPQGTTLVRDMAALFSDDLLDEIAARLLRLLDAFADEGVQVLSYVVRYGEHLLFVRAVRAGGALCVLSDPEVNLPALRMGASLVARRLAGAARAPAGPAALRPSEPPPPPPPAETIRYRGAVMPRGTDH